MTALIAELVVRDPKQRLGHSGNIHALRTHASFASIDWMKIASPANLSPILGVAASEAVKVADDVLDQELKDFWARPFSGSGDLWES